MQLKKRILFFIVLIIVGTGVYTYLSLNSYYPYTFVAKAESDFTTILSLEAYNSNIRKQFLDQQENIYYIDVVEKDDSKDPGQLYITGRLSAKEKIDEKRTAEFIEKYLSTNYSIYLASLLCNQINLNTSKDLISILKKNKEMKKVCLQKHQINIENNFFFTKIDFIEDGRLAKIIFNSIAVVVAFGIALFIGFYKYSHDE